MKNDTEPLRPESTLFTWKNVSIRQGQDVFKIGTDALLLGGWVPGVISKPAHILDAGTGTGILAFMLGHVYTDARITAIDSVASAVTLAASNMEQAGWGQRMEVRCEDLTLPIKENASRFDLVVSNPPFFMTGPASGDENMARAKHLSGSIDGWVEGLTGRVSAGGHLCLIIPYEMAMAWIQKLNAFGFYVQDRLDVRSFSREESPVRTLLHMAQKLKRPLMSMMAIREADGRYTQEYLTMTGIRTAEK